MPARREARLAGMLDLDPGHPGPGLTLRPADARPFRRG